MSGIDWLKTLYGVTIGILLGQALFHVLWKYHPTKSKITDLERRISILEGRHLS
jgi:hypothetical protein